MRRCGELAVRGGDLGVRERDVVRGAPGEGENSSIGSISTSTVEGVALLKVASKERLEGFAEVRRFVSESKMYMPQLASQANYR